MQTGFRVSGIITGAASFVNVLANSCTAYHLMKLSHFVKVENMKAFIVGALYTQTFNKREYKYSFLDTSRRLQNHYFTQQTEYIRGVLKFCRFQRFTAQLL